MCLQSTLPLLIVHVARLLPTVEVSDGVAIFQEDVLKNVMVLRECHVHFPWVHMPPKPTYPMCRVILYEYSHCATCLMTMSIFSSNEHPT